MEQALNKAKDAGYETRWISITHPDAWAGVFLDPLFWQALGKAMRWKEIYCKSGCGCPYPSGNGSHEFGCEWDGDNQWKYEWHRFIDHLDEGNDADSFFTSLLKK